MNPLRLAWRVLCDDTVHTCIDWMRRTPPVAKRTTELAEAARALVEKERVSPELYEVLLEWHSATFTLASEIRFIIRQLGETNVWNDD